MADGQSLFEGESGYRLFQAWISNRGGGVWPTLPPGWNTFPGSQTPLGTQTNPVTSSGTLRTVQNAFVGPVPVLAPAPAPARVPRPTGPTVADRLPKRPVGAAARILGRVLGLPFYVFYPSRTADDDTVPGTMPSDSPLLPPKGPIRRPVVRPPSDPFWWTRDPVSKPPQRPAQPMFPGPDIYREPAAPPRSDPLRDPTRWPTPSPLALPLDIPEPVRLPAPRPRARPRPGVRPRPGTWPNPFPIPTPSTWPTPTPIPRARPAPSPSTPSPSPAAPPPSAFPFNPLGPLGLTPSQPTPLELQPDTPQKADRCPPCESVQRKTRKKGQCRQGYFREYPNRTEFITWSKRKCP